MADTVVHFLGNLDPSLEDVITSGDLPVDLTGTTVKLKMRAESSSALVVDRAAVITDAAAGEVRFDWLAADVDTAGEFNAWWEVTTTATGHTQDTPEFVIAIMAHEPSRWLCELEDVTAYAPGYRSDPATDALLEQLIAAESQRIQRRTSREFRPITPASALRKFHLTEANLRSRVVRLGDVQSVTLVRLLDRDQATELETIVTPNYVLMPETRQEWEPATAVYLPPYSAAASALLAGAVLEVTGVWGFPSIPPEIRQACAASVVFRYMQDAAAAGTRFAEALAEVNLGALFASAREAIDGYMEPLVA